MASVCLPIKRCQYSSNSVTQCNYLPACIWPHHKIVKVILSNYSCNSNYAST